MKKEENQYDQICAEIKELNRKIQCLSACFIVISRPEMIDSVNYELLSLKSRRSLLYEWLKDVKTERSTLGK